MKENIILIFFILVFSYISTPFIDITIKNDIDNDKNIEEIAIANDFWDYLSRFSINK